jgi:predicted MPP superfamily phosphohydrolase
MRAALEKGGAAVLYNSAAKVAVRGQRVQLVGLSDHWAGEIDTAQAYAEAGAELPTVLLEHNPDAKDFIDSRLRWHLMLSGHTHGGQFRTLSGHAPYAPVNDYRYVEGLKPWGSRWIHVTRGVGNVGGIRLNCRPQVSVVDLVAA